MREALLFAGPGWTVISTQLLCYFSRVACHSILLESPNFITVRRITPWYQCMFQNVLNVMFFVYLDPLRDKNKWRFSSFNFCNSIYAPPCNLVFFIKSLQYLLRSLLYLAPLYVPSLVYVATGAALFLLHTSTGLVEHRLFRAATVV